MVGVYRFQKKGDKFRKHALWDEQRPLSPQSVGAQSLLAVKHHGNCHKVIFHQGLQFFRQGLDFFLQAQEEISAYATWERGC